MLWENTTLGPVGWSGLVATCNLGGVFSTLGLAHPVPGARPEPLPYAEGRDRLRTPSAIGRRAERDGAPRAGGELAAALRRRRGARRGARPGRAGARRSTCGCSTSGTATTSGDGVRPARGPLRYATALAGAAAEGRLVHLHTNGANAKSWLVALAASRARRSGAPRGVLTRPLRVGAGLARGAAAPGGASRRRPAPASAGCWR